MRAVEVCLVRGRQRLKSSVKSLPCFPPPAFPPSHPWRSYHTPSCGVCPAPAVAAQRVPPRAGRGRRGVPPGSSGGCTPEGAMAQ